MLSRHLLRLGIGLFLVVLLAPAIGCGPNYKARAVVKGKISFGGKHLTAGNIMFYGPNGLFSSASIDKNGNYVMNDAPLGSVVIAIKVPEMTQGAMGMMGRGPGSGGKGSQSVNPENPSQKMGVMTDMPTHVVPIPAKYANEGTSGLTYTVEKGEHTHDIDLKP